MHYQILDEKRQTILPLLNQVVSNFYLAGGTALALQLGHRDSVDFDFFSTDSFDAVLKLQELERVFVSHHLLVTQEEKDTLSVIIDENVKASFFGYPYPLLDNLISTEYFPLASPLDIGCMKLSAIVSRATLKDYLDMFYILQSYSLPTLLEACQRKYPKLDQNLILKSLIYFEDIVAEPILFMPGFEVSLENIKSDLIDQVKNYQLRVR
jgi:predicted nucleotidyltransferase component of viral defense system